MVLTLYDIRYKQDSATRTLPVSEDPALVSYTTATISCRKAQPTRPVISMRRRKPQRTTTNELIMMASMPRVLRTLLMAKGSSTLAMVKKYALYAAKELATSPF